MPSSYKWEYSENALSVIKPDSITPSQWRDSHGARLENPIHDLMFAVLREAMRQFKNTSKEGVKREIREWAESESLSSPFAFATICTELNIDGGRIRRAFQGDDLKYVPRSGNLRWKHRNTLRAA